MIYDDGKQFDFKRKKKQIPLNTSLGTFLYNSEDECEYSQFENLQPRVFQIFSVKGRNLPLITCSLL